MLSNLNEIANRVCEWIPEGYEIRILLSKDSGFVELHDFNSDEHIEYPSNHELLTDSVEDALQHALDLDDGWRKPLSEQEEKEIDDSIDELLSDGLLEGDY